MRPLEVGNTGQDLRVSSDEGTGDPRDLVSSARPHSPEGPCLSGARGWVLDGRVCVSRTYWGGMPLPSHPSRRPQQRSPLCVELMEALALFQLVGWASQEQFPAISRPGQSTFLRAPLTAHRPAQPTVRGRKGRIRGAVSSTPGQIPPQARRAVPLEGRFMSHPLVPQRQGLVGGTGLPAESRAGGICAHCPLLPRGGGPCSPCC